MSLELWSRRISALGQFRVLDPVNPVLSKDDEHHLRTVLRAKSGEEIVVTNGRGDWTLCSVTSEGLNVVTPLHHDPEVPETTLYMAPLKGDRSEWAVAKATELGVSKIVPLLSERMVVKFKGEAKEKILRRWQRIADESCGQSRRTYDVSVAEPVFVRDVPSHVAICDFDGSPQWQGITDVAIGPEGGWGPDEWGSDRKKLTLGRTVLRGETAAVSAVSLMNFHTGNWAMPTSDDPNR